MIPQEFFLHAVDPGGTTGLALLHVSPSAFTAVDQSADLYDPEHQKTPLITLKKWRAAYDTCPHVLVYENFHVRPGQKAVDTTALRVLGGLEEWLMHETGAYHQAVAQEPVQGKSMVTDEVLNRLGLHAYGKDARHIRDAFRHAVAWLARRSYLPVCTRAWPKKEAA